MKTDFYCFFICSHLTFSSSLNFHVKVENGLALCFFYGEIALWFVFNIIRFIFYILLKEKHVILLRQYVFILA